MQYWWVNHKQTHKAEIEGGYIWSPKKNKNGATNQTYLNLTKVQTNDIIFSYADTQIKAIGIVQQPCIEMDTPAEFGKAGDQWDKQGWLVKVDWVLLDTPFKPKEYLKQIAPLLPKRNSPIQENGNGNQSCYLAAIDAELGYRDSPIRRSASGFRGGSGHGRLRGFGTGCRVAGGVPYDHQCYVRHWTSLPNRQLCPRCAGRGVEQHPYRRGCIHWTEQHDPPRNPGW